jgi:pSer/pThr/pTyr-binding forkhead associated (FHA) protein
MSARHATLRLEFEGGIATPQELREGAPVLVGRSAACEVPLADTDVSREHAAVSLRDGQVFVEDLGSRNGTFVNDARVGGRPVTLHMAFGVDLEIHGFRRSRLEAVGAL